MKSFIPTAALSVLLSTFALASTAIATPPITTGAQRVQRMPSSITEVQPTLTNTARPITTGAQRVQTASRPIVRMQSPTAITATQSTKAMTKARSIATRTTHPITTGAQRVQ